MGSKNCTTKTSKCFCSISNKGVFSSLNILTFQRDENPQNHQLRCHHFGDLTSKLMADHLVVMGFFISWLIGLFLNILWWCTIYLPQFFLYPLLLYYNTYSPKQSTESVPFLLSGDFSFVCKSTDRTFPWSGQAEDNKLTCSVQSIQQRHTSKESQSERSVRARQMIPLMQCLTDRQHPPSHLHPPPTITFTSVPPLTSSVSLVTLQMKWL